MVENKIRCAGNEKLCARGGEPFIIQDSFSVGTDWCKHITRCWFHLPVLLAYCDYNLLVGTVKWETIRICNSPRRKLFKKGQINIYVIIGSILVNSFYHEYQLSDHMTIICRLLPHVTDLLPGNVLFSFWYIL